MNDIQEYYINGFLRRHFQDDVYLKHLRCVLSLLHGSSKRPSTGFEWVSKYPNTEDLRPNVLDYDRVFMDVLFSNDIPALVDRVIGTDMTLAHIQVRRSSLGPSYMDWHRDTYNYGSQVGNVPPVHKLIFYPSTSVEPKLKLLVGSHRCMYNDREADVSLLSRFKQEEYGSSLDEFILFDTSMFHGVIPETREEGSIRVIYSFVRGFQFQDNFAGQQTHDMIEAEYQRRNQRRKKHGT